MEASHWRNEAGAQDGLAARRGVGKPNKHLRCPRHLPLDPFTVPVPTLHSRAVSRMPVPLASSARIAASLRLSIHGRPIGLASQGVGRELRKPTVCTARWRRSAKRMVRGPSPELPGTTRLRRFRPFPGDGEVSTGFTHCGHITVALKSSEARPPAVSSAHPRLTAGRIATAPGAPVSAREAHAVLQPA